LTPLSSVLQHRALFQPEKTAFLFLGENNREEECLEFGRLDLLARALAAELLSHASKGDRVLLMFPSGLVFIVAFFACHYAGLIPVPMVPPGGRRMRDSAGAVAKSCRPAIGLVSPASMAPAVAFFQTLENMAELKLMALDFDHWQEHVQARPLPAAALHQPDLEEVAFIQYTSGSTSAPKGVAVTHRNLLANLEMMATVFENDTASTYVGWAPLYHDMGLIANVLEPFYVGALSVLMCPRRFAREPWQWLRAISDYKARVSGGPNFGYELCVQRAGRMQKDALDLSHWKLAFNSAEPVKCETLQRFWNCFAFAGFRYESFYPCYGLADATLLVSGGRVDEEPIVMAFSKSGLQSGMAYPPTNAADSRLLVSAGQALSGESVVVVDPESLTLLGDRQVGEIWISGANVPVRYWGEPGDVSQQAFGARLKQLSGRRFLRSGDLGFLNRGELFITGRLKDMLVVRGRNIYPQDIEAIAEAAAPGLRANANAAFAIQRNDAEAESVVLIQEIDRTSRHEDLAPIAAAIRAAVLAELEIALHDVLIVEPGTVPKTSSGKTRRAEAKRGYLLCRPARAPGAVEQQIQRSTGGGLRGRTA
jgi:acyl-CoA synthetase (AMP-forming)/AMP-acid ligase II